MTETWLVLAFAVISFGLAGACLHLWRSRGAYARSVEALNQEILDAAEAQVFEIKEAGARASQGFQNLQPLLVQVVNRIDELYSRDNPSDVTGVPTGFSDLDNKTSGLQPGDLVIVAGRPSMGKTAFSLNIAENVALDTSLPVAVFSMEMAAINSALLPTSRP